MCCPIPVGLLSLFFFRGTVIKSRDKARTVLCRSRYLRYLSPFFTLRAALLFFALISLHQNAKNRKKKKLEKRKRERGSTGTFAPSELGVHRARQQEKGLELEEEEGWGVLGRQGRILEQRCPRDLHVPGFQVGHPTWLYPLRGLPCPWNPHSSCSLPWSAPGWLWELGLGFGSSRGIPARAFLLMSPSLWPCCHPGLSQTERLGVDTKPSLFPFHGFWERNGPGRTWSCFPQEGGWLQLSTSGVICHWISPELDLCPRCHLVLMCSECCLSIPTPSHSCLEYLYSR